METIRDILLIFIPFLAAQLGLAIFALVHVLQHPNYRFGNKIVWALVVLLVSFIGPIIYFVFGRGEEQ